MRRITHRSSVESVLGNEDAAAVVRELEPGVFDSPFLRAMGEFPFGPALGLVLGIESDRVDRLIERLSAFEDTSPRPPEESAIAPDPAFEDDMVARGGAAVELPDGARVHARAEVTLHGPAHGNPFVDVELSATFTSAGRTVRVGGFYDGDGRYRLRFLPPSAGTWTLTTSSTARSLDGITAELEVAPGDAHGPVRVADTFAWAHADGTPFVPFGTTAYAWIHQSEALQDDTIRSLAAAPFNKIRMCLFPKSYLHNTGEPERFVFPRDGEGWDTTRFDLEWFARMERRLEQLGELGVHADLILFHPYDRWGFSTMSAAADDRYLRYVVRRLSAFPNVWWSMANEYDLLLTKEIADWDRLGRIVVEEDPVGHPVSIHNWVEIYDNSADWITHASVQRGGDTLPAAVAQWRRQWGKPVLLDECGYEGNLEPGWGSLRAEDVVHAFWSGVFSGASCTHGETFWDADDVIWWSKGGTLHGESPARIAFLRDLVAQSPTARLVPLDGGWDFARAGVAGQYVIDYFGTHRPLYRTVTVPEGMTARIDVIDGWNMTVEEVPGVHTGAVRVDLPARPHVAVRMRAVEKGAA
jgi:hypothetical protein